MFSPKNSGNLVVGKNLLERGNGKLTELIQKIASGETGVGSVIIDNKNCYLAYAPMSETEMNFVIVIEADEVVAPANANKQAILDTTEKFLSEMSMHIFNVLGLLALVIFILVMAVAFAANKLADNFINPIKKLTDGVKEIAGGDLNKKIQLDTGDEIESLAVSFNAMTDELQRYMTNLTKVTADKERIATELNVATNIQTGMLPNMFPAFPERDEFDIYATMHAAKEVGGDFYDFYLLDENHLVITIADVSGKGVPAALFMAISKTILRNFAMSMQDPNDFAAVMELSNRQICENNDEMMFVTVFMGMIDIRTGEFIYVNDGHNPPLVCHNGKFKYIDVGKSCVLGIDEDVPFKQQKMQLSKGDMIYLYTDGVTEAMNEQGEQYLPEHLEEELNREDSSEDLTTLLENMQVSIKQHAGKAEQSDDITMLAFRLN